MNELINPRYDTIDIGGATVLAASIVAVSEFGYPGTLRSVARLASGEERIGTRPYADVVADWQAHLTRCREWENKPINNSAWARVVTQAEEVKP